MQNVLSFFLMENNLTFSKMNTFNIRESDLFKVLMLKTRFNKTGTLFTIN